MTHYRVSIILCNVHDSILARKKKYIYFFFVYLCFSLSLSLSLSLYIYIYIYIYRVLFNKDKFLIEDGLNYINSTRKLIRVCFFFFRKSVVVKLVKISRKLIYTDYERNYIGRVSRLSRSRLIGHEI